MLKNATKFAPKMAKKLCQHLFYLYFFLFATTNRKDILFVIS